MILAAGLGTRLRPLTLTRPKAMIPIANVPLLERTLRLLAKQNVRSIAINLFHLSDAISSAFGDGAELGVQLRYSYEERLLGTAGGVKRMEAFFDETFLVLYADNLWHADLARLLSFHRQRGALVTIATHKTDNPSASGLLLADPDGRVIRFQEKPPFREVFTDTANAGVYVMEPQIFRYIPRDTVVDFAQDIFPELVNLGMVYALPIGGYVRDTGTPEGYRRASWDILAGKVGDVAASGGPLVAPTARAADSTTFEGRNVVGAGCRISAHAVLAETIMWDECDVGVAASIYGAVLGRNVRVGDGAVIGRGALVADGARVSVNACVLFGARIEPGETVD